MLLGMFFRVIYSHYVRWPSRWYYQSLCQLPPDQSWAMDHSVLQWRTNHLEDHPGPEYWIAIAENNERVVVIIVLLSAITPLFCCHVTVPGFLRLWFGHFFQPNLYSPKRSSHNDSANVESKSPADIVPLSNHVSTRNQCFFSSWWCRSSAWERTAIGNSRRFSGKLWFSLFIHCHWLSGLTQFGMKARTMMKLYVVRQRGGGPYNHQHHSQWQWGTPQKTIVSLLLED